MKIAFEKVPRFPHWPLWSILLVLCWMMLGGIAVALGFETHANCSACWFKLFFKIPCPTCGFGRGMTSILHGDIFHGFLYNPLLFTILAGWLFLILIRALFCKSLRVVLSPGERVELFGLTFCMFFANWIYLIVAVG